MKNSIYVLAVLTILFTACKNSKKKESEKMKMNHSKMMEKQKDNHAHNKAIRVINTDSIEKNPATSGIIDGYLQIKKGLASDSSEKAAEGAKALLTAFSKFDMEKLDAKTHKKYMDIYKNAKENAEHITKSEIKHQREHFKNLSNNIIDLIALLGTDKTLYQQYCPMAKAGWISEAKEIRNPFYGAKMLKCGFVKKTIN